MSADAGSAAEDGSVFRLPLQTERFFLEPLTPKDFNALYAVASDPLLWEQHPEADRCIRIGYTFIARELWGTAANREIKKTMLTRAFKVVDRVFFDIGPQNFRSIAAVMELGAVFSHDESDSKAVYMLSKQQWFKTFRVC